MTVNFNSPEEGSGTLEREMREELQAVLSSELFIKSPVMSQLLAFLVEATLKGDGDRLKAYSVAVDGLGRHPDFDPATDSYPRVQVGRLRKALEAYYAHKPAHAAPCLNIPAGGYRVRLSLRRVAYPGLSQPRDSETEIGFGAPQEFETAAAPIAAVEIQPRSWRMPVLAALIVIVAALLLWAQPWKTSQARPESPQVLLSSVGGGALAVRTNNNIADGLRRSWVLRVSLGASGARDRAFRYEIQTQPQDLANGETELFVRVIDRDHGGVIWSANQRVSAEPNAMDATLGPLIAQLGAPFGVIARTERARLGGDDSAGYACMLLFGEYFRLRDPTMKAKVERCVSKASGEPHLAPAIEAARAILVFVKATEPTERPAALRKARAMAAATLDNYWDSADALLANATLAFYANECARAGLLADRAIAANPYDPNMYGSLGVLTYQCDKTKARALLEQARALEPDGPVNFRIPLLMMAARGDAGIDVDALSAEMQSSARSSPAMTFLGLSLVASAKGDKATARRQWRAFRRLAGQPDASTDEVLRPFIISDSLRAMAIRQLTEGGALQA